MPTIDELMDEGNTALAIGEMEDAAKYFRQVVEQDPQFQDGWHALGMALYKLDRYPEAIEAGLRAAKIDPNASRTAVARRLTRRLILACRVVV